MCILYIVATVAGMGPPPALFRAASGAPMRGLNPVGVAESGAGARRLDGFLNYLASLSRICLCSLTGCDRILRIRILSISTPTENAMAK